MDRAGHASLAVGLCFVFAIGACNRDASSSETSPGADSTETREGRRERPVRVDVAAVTRGELVISILAEGIVRARRAADVSSEISGRVERILAEEGSRVRAGAVIARLDDRALVVALEEARASYLRKLSQLAVEDGRIPGGDTTRAKTPARDVEPDLAELERLEARGEITRAERIRREIELQLAALSGGGYREEVSTARSGVAEAHAKLERARLDLEHARIKAPFSGVVSEIHVSEGELIQLNEVVCRIVDDRHLEAEVGVLESDLRGLETGTQALVSIPALGDTIRAKVDVLSPEVDDETRTCRVLMRISGEGGVRPGMFVRAAIAGRRLADRLLVPASALLTRDGRPLVFKVEGEKAKWIYVEIGARNEELVEIVRALRGGTLEPGDPVVVSNHLTLAHDAMLDVQKSVAPNDPWSDGE